MDFEFSLESTSRHGASISCFGKNPADALDCVLDPLARGEIHILTFEAVMRVNIFVYGKCGWTSINIVIMLHSQMERATRLIS